MPYSVRKQGNKYCVFKKEDGSKVGCTDGNKESLKKYLGALHMHETNSMKLSNLVKENASGMEGMSTEQKKAFLEAVYKFAEHAPGIYRQHSLKETADALNHMIEAANHLTLSETEDWFDKVTVSRHMKQLGEAQKIFDKTAAEMSTLQQRLESAYEDIGGVLGKYYDIGSMVNEAAESGPDYQQFFKKALKKFKVAGPEDLESDKTKKKFFNYVDANYTSEKEKAATAAPKEKEEPKESDVEEGYYGRGDKRRGSKKTKTNESKYAFGNPALEGAARKKVWNYIMKNSSNISTIKKLGAIANSIAGTKLPVIDSDDLNELVDDLSGEHFESMYRALQQSGKVR
jgi:hypothetical protein